MKTLGRILGVVATLAGLLLTVSAFTAEQAVDGACKVGWRDGGGIGGSVPAPAYTSSLATMWYLKNNEASTITINGGNSSVTGNFVDDEVDLPWTTVDPGEEVDLYVVVETGSAGSGTIDLTISLSGAGCSGNSNATPTKIVTIQ